MAIDIRATVTCSLGTLISGSLSDDYLQGSGLIKTRGTCEISGTITPAIGTVVTFSYTKGGVTRSIPRKLRVLSSFADPFRRTTKVELGCKLTYLQDFQEPVKWTAFDDDENNDYNEADQRIVTLPIHASSVMAECLSQLGITASSSPLTNKFSVAEFDFGPGYVQVLSDLLVSESYFGYLDSSEVLQIVSLDQDGGTGPVITASDIVEIGPIGVGQLPGEAVTVSYSSLRLKNPEDGGNELLDWETREAIGLEKTVEIENVYYPNGNTYAGAGTIGREEVFVYKYRPRTVVTTTYDALDRVAKRVTTDYSIIADLAPGYMQYISGFTFGVPLMSIGSAEQQTITTETFVYKLAANAAGASADSAERDEIVEQIRTVHEPHLKYYSSTNIYSLIASPADAFGTGDTFMGYRDLQTTLLTEKEATTFQYGAGKDGAKIVETTTNKFLCEGYTQQGQQALAKALADDNGIRNIETWTVELLERYAELSYLGTEVEIVTGREIALQQRPDSADIAKAKYADGGDINNGWSTESKAELELALGSATAQRRIEFSLPYAPDDVFTGPSGGPFTATPSDAQAKANRYGRIQNRLLLGNRSGVNLQVAPERLPNEPFSPIYLQANGLTALYRSNGNQWAFDSNGIVCSTDSLFWAAVGGTGTFWFPVAPGVTTLPTTPAVVDGQMNATTVVLPYNETAIYDARVRLGSVVSKFEYALELLTTAPALSVKMGSAVSRIRKVAVPAAAVTVAVQAPKVSISAKVQPPAASVAMAAVAPAVAGGASVSVPLSSIAVEALVPDVQGTPSINVLVPSADLSLAAVAPAVSTGVSVTVPAGGITVAGVAPSITVAVTDPDFSSVSLLLHLDGSNGGTTFTDSSSNANTMTRGGNAQLSTSDYKFGTASVVWDGSGDFLRTPDSTLFGFGTGDFTIEFWSYFASGFNTGTGAILMSIGDFRNITYTGSTLRFRTNSGTNLITGGALSTSTWYHIALTKSGNDHKLFIDGTQAGSTYTSSTSYTVQRITFGANNSGQNNYLGNMDDIRVTKGVARYTSNFTAPTQPFPDS
jgi:hypothetical protein